MPLLEIEDLHVEFPSQAGGVLRAVEGVSLVLDEGDVLGIVGESGSGKSVTMLAVMGLVAEPGRVRAKKLTFAGRNLLRHRSRGQTCDAQRCNNPLLHALLLVCGLKPASQLDPPPSSYSNMRHSGR